MSHKIDMSTMMTMTMTTTIATATATTATDDDDDDDYMHPRTCPIGNNNIKY